MTELDFLLSNAHPILSAEEESVAVREAMAGSKVARDKLVTSNLKLVVKIVRGHHRGDNRIDLMDLVQEGNEGLIESLGTFDPTKGTRFTTHAGWRIRARVLRFIVANIRLVRVKRGESERLLFQMAEAKRQLEAEDITPTPARLAEVLDAPVSKVEEMQLRLSSPEGSLNAPAGDDDESGVQRIDNLSDAGADTFANVASKECCELVSAKLRSFLERWNLSKRDRAILRFRILTDDPHSLESIGQDFGLTRQRIQQIEQKLRAKVIRHIGGLKTELA